MKRLFVITLLVVALPAAVCQAAAPPDYAFGRLALDAGTGFASFSPGYDDSRISWDVSLTAGLGAGFAARYSYGRYSGDIGLTNRQITLYDHIFGPVGVFVGASQTATAGTDPRGGIVYGVAGSLPLAPRTSAYASLGGGSHVSSREFGIGYKLNGNAELGLSYRYSKYGGLKLAGGGDGEVAAEGFYSGVTFRL